MLNFFIQSKTCIFLTSSESLFMYCKRSKTASSWQILHFHVAYCEKFVNIERQKNVTWKNMIDMSFLGERSEAYSHKDTSKWFRFFPVRDIPLRFNTFNLIFPAPIGRIHPVLASTLRRVHDLSYSKFSVAETFFGELLMINSIFGLILKAKSIFLSSVFAGSFEVSIFLH